MAYITIDELETLDTPTDEDYLIIGKSDLNKITVQKVRELLVIIDKTLTESGKPADAKTVGDKIGEIEKTIDDLNNDKNTKIEELLNECASLDSSVETLEKALAKIGLYRDEDGDLCESEVIET